MIFGTRSASARIIEHQPPQPSLFGRIHLSNNLTIEIRRDSPKTRTTMSEKLSLAILSGVFAAVGATFGSYVFKPHEEAEKTKMHISSKVIDEYLESGYAYTQAVYDWCHNSDPTDWENFQKTGDPFRSSANRIKAYFVSVAGVQESLKAVDDLYTCLGTVCGKCLATDVTCRHPPRPDASVEGETVRLLLKEANLCVSTNALASEGLGDSPNAGVCDIKIPELCLASMPK